MPGPPEAELEPSNDLAAGGWYRLGVGIKQLCLKSWL